MNNKELMAVNYETAMGTVNLDSQTVKDYLVRGNGDISDQEVILFIQMCKAQKLNPFVTGEVYLIKFGSQPAQMVVGYDTYKRRAEENPNHLYTESGIVVSRGGTGEIVQKSGACLYPTETLIGGWCRVHKLKENKEVTTYKEVSLAEYNKNNSIWKEKPCTMIEKVAISQCLRESYPKDYQGLYTTEELAPEQYNEFIDTTINEKTTSDDDPVITQSERQLMFSKVQKVFGKDEGNEILKELIKQEGLESTSNMKNSSYIRIMEKIDTIIKELSRTTEE